MAERDEEHAAEVATLRGRAANYRAIRDRLPAGDSLGIPSMLVDSVIAAADSTIEACFAVVESCEARVASRDTVNAMLLRQIDDKDAQIAAVRDEVRVLKESQPDFLDKLLSHGIAGAIGVVVGVILVVLGT